jgi:hypothetical protein
MSQAQFDAPPRADLLRATLQRDAARVVGEVVDDSVERAARHRQERAERDRLEREEEERVRRAEYYADLERMDAERTAHEQSVAERARAEDDERLAAAREAEQRQDAMEQRRDDFDLIA